MKRSLSIQTEPIDEARLQSQRRISTRIGAVIYFLGVVREEEEGAVIQGIDYEAFEKMAIHQFDKILDEIEKRWPIQSVRLVHRIGRVNVNEPSLWVEVTSPHRGEAFAACEYLIDEMKKRVPIWKRPLASSTNTS
jgi:molybdopterin synthase catalytic subunit